MIHDMVPLSTAERWAVYKLRNVIWVGLLFVACKNEDDAAKKEAERLRAEVEAMKAEKAARAQAETAQENERLKAELAAAQARTTPASSSSPRQARPPEQPAGQQIINEFIQLKEGQQMVWRIPPGRYRVRATASNSGLKAKWVGTDCASSKKEVKVYDSVCEVSSESQLVIENPAGFTGLGPTEAISVNATTM